MYVCVCVCVCDTEYKVCFFMLTQVEKFYKEVYIKHLTPMADHGLLIIWQWVVDDANDDDVLNVSSSSSRGIVVN